MTESSSVKKFSMYLPIRGWNQNPRKGFQTLCSPSSVPEDHDERTEEHVEAVTICQRKRLHCRTAANQDRHAAPRAQTRSRKEALRQMSETPSSLQSTKPGGPGGLASTAFCVHCASDGGGEPSSTTSEHSISRPCLPQACFLLQLPSCQTPALLSMCPNRC